MTSIGLSARGGISKLKNFESKRSKQLQSRILNAAMSSGFGLAIALWSSPSMAQYGPDYLCKIDRVIPVDVGLSNDFGDVMKSFKGKTFTVARRSGVMAGTLQAGRDRPEIINYGGKDSAYQVINRFPAAVLSRVTTLVVQEFNTSPAKPFVFLDVDMAYFGTCNHF